MKIATYNLRFGGKSGNRIHWQKLIESSNPNILLLQETLSPHEYLLEEIYQAHSLQIHWSAVAGQKWGSAVYIRQEQVIPLEPLSAALSGWVTGVQITHFSGLVAKEQALYVYSIHAPSVGSSYVKQVNLILDGIKAQIPQGADVIVGGNFNLTLGLRHPSEQLQQNQPELMNRFRYELGLMNCWQMANSNQNLPQTLRWCRNKALPFHCDGLFVPIGWYRSLEKAEVLAGDTWDILSDHNPVVATFEAPNSIQIPPL